MNKKIGIITFWGVPNYGAWTQAYALNKVLTNLKGNTYDVEHIAYLTDHHYLSYYRNDMKLLNNFKYNWNQIPHSMTMTEKDLEDSFYDVIITGSDSIWEFSMDTTDNDRHLIGNDLKTNNLIAYAASAGVSVNENKDYIVDGLKKYNAIAVRDIATKRMVEKLTGIKSTIVPDPSILYDFSGDNSIPTNSFENYIFVYGIKWDKGFVEGLKQFASDRSLKLVSVGYINDWCDYNFRLIEIRAKEWIGLIKQSSYVATSMFHGLMVGLNLGKHVFFDRVPYVVNRSESLLSITGMPFYSEKSNDEVKNIFDVAWNKEKINNGLNSFRKVGLEFLNGNIQ